MIRPRLSVARWSVADEVTQLAQDLRHLTLVCRAEAVELTDEQRMTLLLASSSLAGEIAQGLSVDDVVPEMEAYKKYLGAYVDTGCTGLREAQP